MNVNIAKEISEKIKSRRTVIFCGAGISFDSGLPIVGNFLNNLFEKIKLTEDHASIIKHSELPFEAIIETLSDETSIEPLLEIFESGEPNTSHFFIAKLAKEGYVNVVCTTNFDLLIEKALIIEKLYPEKDFKVYRTGKEIEVIDWEADHLKLIKIHGCVSNKSEMAITMRQVAGREYVESRAEVVNEIYSGDRFSNVLILGYSCSDAFDISPYIQALPENSMSIHFIEHSNKTQANVEDIRIKEFKNPFKKFVNGKRITADTTRIIRQLWEELLHSKYELFPRNEINWEAKIDEWAEKADNDGPKEIGFHIAARLFYSIGNFDEAIKLNKKAIGVATKQKDLTAKSAALGNLAMAYNAKGQYNKAASTYEQSILLCRKSRNVQGLIAQLQGYGILLHRIRKNEQAIKVHQEALFHAIKEKDENGISNTLGNMASAYNSMNRPDEAIRCLDRALPISKKLGNKQSESSQIASIAISYMLMQNLDESLKYNLKALEIKRMIGDRQGTCVLLLNTANTLANLNRRNEARELNKECLIMAKEIGNRELEMKAIVNEAIIG